MQLLAKYILHATESVLVACKATYIHNRRDLVWIENFSNYFRRRYRDSPGSQQNTCDSPIALCHAAPSSTLSAPWIRNLIKTMEKQEKYHGELNEFKRMTEEEAHEQGGTTAVAQWYRSTGTSFAAGGRTSPPSSRLIRDQGLIKLAITALDGAGFVDKRAPARFVFATVTARRSGSNPWCNAARYPRWA